MKFKNYYLIFLQYLGFRYHGWQIQPGQPTVESKLNKTLRHILPGRKFRILGAGRTDARVSALEAAFELFLDGPPLADHKAFLDDFNNNLPPDIRVLRITDAHAGFNIIQDIREKEYLYLFSFGAKNHPLAAPFIANFLEALDIGLMKKAAGIFQGTHDFSAYTTGAGRAANRIRTVSHAEISENAVLSASFFPEISYMLVIRGKGFIRYQVRMIMGALVELGRGNLTMADIERSLQARSGIALSCIAPGSGLFLNRLDFH